LSRSPVFLRRAKAAVAPVVSTVMLVAITVVLAAVLFVLVSSMLNPPPPPPVAITFTSLGWSGGNNTAVIQSVTGASAVSVADLEYQLRDSDNTLMYSGKADQAVPTQSVTITIHYEDLDSGERITPGDKIIVTVDPISGSTLVDGGVLEIYAGGKQIASHAIA
jgi:FlaG/FlaF family flagellin (archaellin)